LCFILRACEFLYVFSNFQRSSGLGFLLMITRPWSQLLNTSRRCMALPFNIHIYLAFRLETRRKQAIYLWRWAEVIFSAQFFAFSCLSLTLVDLLGFQIGLQNCGGAAVYEKVEWEANYCPLKGYMSKTQGSRKWHFTGIYDVLVSLLLLVHCLRPSLENIETVQS
jgi:hypothetical protein